MDEAEASFRSFESGVSSEFHRAYAEDTPPPAPKMLSNDALSVRLHGYVGKGGTPFGLKVLDAWGADLGPEAIRIVLAWRYHPAMCTYDPATMETDFEVHFKGW
jgi:hypothetical protein